MFAQNIVAAEVTSPGSRARRTANGAETMGVDLLPAVLRLCCGCRFLPLNPFNCSLPLEKSVGEVLVVDAVGLWEVGLEEQLSSSMCHERELHH